MENLMIHKFIKYMQNGKVLIQSARPESTDRTIYQIDINTGNGTMVQSSAMKRKGAFFSASFSENGRYMVLASLGPDEPEYVIKPTFEEGQGFNIVDNSEVAKSRSEVGFPTYNFEKIEIVLNEELNENRTVHNFNSLIQYPPRYVAGRNYPTILNIYNGPASQSVVKTFSKTSTGLNALLVSQGFIVVSFDGRGTGFRGEKFMQQVYKQLGNYEVEDTLNVAKWIHKQNFSKKKHISLWGWSYGGYSAIKTYLNTRTDDTKSLFKYIIAGAPVTDWTFYDTAYTERYMLTPQQNPDGYKNSTCLDIPNDINNSTSKLILIHGTADDNVHLLNSYHFMLELQKKILFLIL